LIGAVRHECRDFLRESFALFYCVFVLSSISPCYEISAFFAMYGVVVAVVVMTDIAADHHKLRKSIIIY
jgi:hypothetical protein